MAGDSYSMEVTVLSPMGIHSRPAAEIAKMVSRYKSDVRMARKDDASSSADCASILSMLMLAATCGTKMVVTATGEDSEQAVNEIVAYFNSRFGE